MVESQCVYNGNVLLQEAGVLNIDECIQLNELLQGKFYVYDSDKKDCTIYDSKSRNCSLHRGVKDVNPASCPN